MEEKKEKKIKDYQVDIKINSKLRIFIMIISIIIFLIGFLYFKNLNTEYGFDKNCDTESSSSEDTPSSVVLQENEISLSNDDVVKFTNIYGYEYNNIGPKYVSIYNEETVEVSDLEPDHKKSITFYNYLKQNNIVSSRVSCSELVNKNIEFTCNDENNALVSGVLMNKYTISNNDFSKAYKEIFGSKENPTIGNFITADNYECTNELGQYVCIGSGNLPIGIETISYPVQAFKYDDRLEVFIQYVWLEGRSGFSNFNKTKVFFDNYNAKQDVSNLNNVKINYRDKIDIYKFTFQKDSNDSYYWTKTELVK